MPHPPKDYIDKALLQARAQQIVVITNTLTTVPLHRRTCGSAVRAVVSRRSSPALSYLGICFSSKEPPNNPPWISLPTSPGVALALFLHEINLLQILWYLVLCLTPIPQRSSPPTDQENNPFNVLRLLENKSSFL